MKVTYLERVEDRTAINRKMYCGECGEHGYQVVEQLEPYTITPWSCRCPVCGNETLQYPTRKKAVKAWQELYAEFYVTYDEEDE